MKFLLVLILVFQFYCKTLNPNAQTILKNSKVITIDTGIANIYLIPSSQKEKWILIDNGDAGDEKDLIPRLKKVGVTPENILVSYHRAWSCRSWRKFEIFTIKVFNTDPRRTGRQEYA